MKYLAFGFSGMGLTMNCRAEYTPPCKNVHVYVIIASINCGTFDNAIQ